MELALKEGSVDVLHNSGKTLVLENAYKYLSTTVSKYR